MPNRISLVFPAFLFAAVCSAADLTGTAVDAAGATIPGARVTAATGALTARSGTATPAAASAVSALTFGSAALGLYWGTGSPNTALTAAKGSLYMRTDGSGVADRAYLNTDGSTAWTAIATAA